MTDHLNMFFNDIVTEPACFDPWSDEVYAELNYPYDTSFVSDQLPAEFLPDNLVNDQITIGTLSTSLLSPINLSQNSTISPVPHEPPCFQTLPPPPYTAVLPPYVEEINNHIGWNVPQEPLIPDPRTLINRPPIKSLAISPTAPAVTTSFLSSSLNWLSCFGAPQFDEEKSHPKQKGDPERSDTALTRVPASMQKFFPNHISKRGSCPSYSKRHLECRPAVCSARFHPCWWRISLRDLLGKKKTIAKQGRRLKKDVSVRRSASLDNPNKRFVCLMCRRRMHNANDLGRHTAKHLIFRLRCPNTQCNSKTFTRDDALKRHILNKEGCLFYCNDSLDDGWEKNIARIVLGEEAHSEWCYARQMLIRDSEGPVRGIPEDVRKYLISEPEFVE